MAKRWGLVQGEQVPVFKSKEEIGVHFSSLKNKKEISQMDESLNGKIDSRLTEVKATYEKLEREKTPLLEQRPGLVNQVSALDRRVNEINTAIFGLNERFNELVILLPKAEQAKWVQPQPEQKEVTKTIPKKKKK